MARRSREIEFLILAAYSVIPQYGEAGISTIALALFQGALLILVGLRFAGRDPLLPAVLLNAAAVVYIVFFPFDVMRVRLIDASTHLLFFICVWQAVSVRDRLKFTQRMLVVALLFVASVATSTSVLMVPFAGAFFLLFFRQLIQLSHEESLSSIGSDTDSMAMRRAAAVYLIPAAIVAMLLFPMMPRLKGSFVQGILPSLNESSTTGLSSSIDFNEMRNISADESAVSRITMPREAVPFFTPIRLRGEVYDRWEDGRWVATREAWSILEPSGTDDEYRIRRGSGIAPVANIEQQMRRDTRLYLPDQTYRILGVPHLIESEAGSIYRIPRSESKATYEFRAQLAWEVQPLEPVARPELIDYPISSEVAQLSGEVAGSAQSTQEKAEAITRFLLGEFKYLQNPGELGRTLSVDEFLLQERRGHCEYFAAGMVVLLRAQDVPARIVGGFYGGKLNPLTGQWVLSLSDAHAWVEVWDAGRWVVYDPTPPDLRPGTASDGLLRAYLAAIVDSITYFWDRYVLTFGLQDQVELLVSAFRGLRSAASGMRGGVTAAAGNPAVLIGIVLLALLLFFLPRLRESSRSRSIGERLVRLLDSHEIAVSSSMTLGEVVERVRAIRPDLVPAVQTIVAAAERDLFSPQNLDRAERQQALTMLRELKSQI